MLSETINRSKCRKSHCPYPKSVNLYRFIRLILGKDITDTEITRRWKMDQKNFFCFKTGKYRAPRLERLEQLAKMLKINKHLVFEVAGGAPAVQVFRLIKENNLKGQIKLLCDYPALGEIRCSLCSRVLGAGGALCK